MVVGDCAASSTKSIMLYYPTYQRYIIYLRGEGLDLRKGWRGGGGPEEGGKKYWETKLFSPSCFDSPGDSDDSAPR